MNHSSSIQPDAGGAARFVRAIGAMLLLGIALLSGCRKPASESLVLYTSVDEPIARPIVQAFEKQTGVRVTLVTDAEATKTAGLIERIRAERLDPQCDVYWGNEPFHTINLAADGLLAPYDSPSARDVPEQFKDPEHRWAGSGLRARVLVAHAGPSTDPSNPTIDAPTGLEELGDPVFKDKIVMSRPVGTVAGHWAALYAVWGEPRADAFFNALRSNHVKLVGGNSIVADLVGAGTAQVGVTDNDDADNAVAQGGHLTSVLPDQDGFGTLLIPATVCLTQRRAIKPAAEKLVDYLLSSDVERKLLDAHFCKWSVRSHDLPKAMLIDYPAVAKTIPDVVYRTLTILEGR